MDVLLNIAARAIGTSLSMSLLIHTNRDNDGLLTWIEVSNNKFHTQVCKTWNITTDFFVSMTKNAKGVKDQRL